MKVYLFVDQEGVAGVFSRREKYRYGTEYSTMEVAAVCEALLANGVTEIVVNTPHELEYHRLPSGVMVFHGEPTRDFFSEGLDSSFSAVMILGMHEMAGGREKGCWRHTVLPHPITQAYSSIEGVWLNSTVVGEIGLEAAFAGIHSVPVVLVTGDHWACLEARDLLGDVETVAIKRGTSYFAAMSMHPADAARASAAGAVRALGKIGAVRPLTFSGPVDFTVRYLFPERATDAVTVVRGAVRVDEKTVRKRFGSVAELLLSMGALRAPETELYAADLGMEQATGFFTRYGVEPYQSAQTFPLPGR